MLTTFELRALLDALPYRERLMGMVFYGFRIMYGIAILMFAVATASLWLRWKRRLFTTRWFLRCLVTMTPSVSFPGGVMTQIYWHTKAPSYAPFAHVPENRVYVSEDAADMFIRSFLALSGGAVVSDEHTAPGDEIGKPGTTFRRIQVGSTFGKLVVFVTDGHLPYPYGRETTGYEVDDLMATLEKAKSLGAEVLVPPFNTHRRNSATVQFPGGYIAEIHSPASQGTH